MHFRVLFIIDEIPSAYQIIYDPIGATPKHISVKTIQMRQVNATDSKTVKDVVSYQRFGRIQNNPSFKCHLCGFSCGIKESLLNHFNKTHPHWGGATKANRKQYTKMWFFVMFQSLYIFFSNKLYCFAYVFLFLWFFWFF